MKKLIIAFDGTHYSKGAIEFAQKMNEQSKVLLTAVFLPQIDYSNLWSYAGGVSGSLFIPLVEDDEAALIEANITRFEQTCVRHNIEYRIHKHLFDLALPELKKETRFADLLIIGSESFYENLGVKNLNDSLKDALREAECPVVVVPENFEFPQSNILSYDGSADSVYAIKQFAYLFPELVNNRTLLVCANESAGKFPNEQAIEEFASRHFPDLTLLKMQIKPKDFFNAWMKNQNGTILISGAFSRSVFSEIFKRSFVSDVIIDHRVPVFNAHW